jgi:autotransporter-associated beta strand protein
VRCYNILTLTTMLTLGTLLLTPAHAGAQAVFEWKGGNPGEWANGGNWNCVSGDCHLGYPNNRGDAAVFDLENSGSTIMIDRPIEVGSLTFGTTHGFLLEARSTGQLQFDNSTAQNPANPAFIFEFGAPTAFARFGIPIVLFSPLNIDGLNSGAPIIFDLAPITGPNGISMTNADVRFFLPDFVGNSYTGRTTINSGLLTLGVHGGNHNTAIPGELVIGTGQGGPKSAFVSVKSAHQIGSLPVTVNADGGMEFQESAQLGDLTIRGGVVTAALGTTLGMSRLTMNHAGSTLETKDGSTLQLRGDVTVSDGCQIVGVGPAASTLDLLDATRTFTVSSGGLLITNIAVTGSGNAGLLKTGVGTLSFGDGGGPNTYPGETQVVQGFLLAHRNAICVPHQLNVGFGTDPAVFAQDTPSIAPGTTLSVGVNGSVRTSVSQAFSSMNLSDGAAVHAGGAGAVTLSTSALTLSGARVALSDGSVFLVDGDIHATSNTRAPATIGVDDSSTGQLTIGGSNRAIVVDRGPLPIDLQIDVPIARVTDDSLIKRGAGIALFAQDNPYRGTTSIETGTLFVNGSTPGPFALAGGVLGGTGTVGAITAPGGTIAPGMSPGKLTTGALGLTMNTAVSIEITGPTAGTAYDQLDVHGPVNVNQAALAVALSFVPANGSKFTIINNDGTDPVIGTFRGVAEGDTIDVHGTKFTVSYRGGDGNDVVLSAGESTAPALTYYLSEGATSDFFDEDVLIANPNDADAPVTLTFSKENGQQVTQDRTVPAKSRVTVHVDQIAGLEGTSASTQVTSNAGKPLVVERSMFWDKNRYAGHTGSAVDAPGPDWFFAEGSQGFFQTFVLVLNPNSTPTDVTFTFLRESDTPIVKTITVGATSRLTLDCGSIPAIVNRSFGIAVHATQPILAERSMYFGTTPTRLWSGGTESAGVQAASTHWFLAEGATGGFFTTYVLLSNPQDADAHVTLQYLLPDGQAVTRQKTLAAHTRLTTNIQAEDDVRLHDGAMSTVVTSDVPVIAERSMYWPGAAQPWGEGHNSFGVVEAGLTWGLAEGRTGGPLNYHTYILLANPQTTAANVTVTFLRESGEPLTKTFIVPPTSRFNIDSGDPQLSTLHDENFGALIQVTNNVPIIVERSLYWDALGFRFSGGTNATAIHLP